VRYLRRGSPAPAPDMAISHRDGRAASRNAQRLVVKRKAKQARKADTGWNRGMPASR
jgi:hypothetical protein